MKKLALVLLASGWAGSVQAGVIAEDLHGAGDDIFFIGQSFTTTAAAFDNIRFSFYDPTGARQALGTAYLFSAEYSGTPDGLASASANLIASAVGNGSAYAFDPSLRLDPSTRYYLYSDTAMNLLGGGAYYNGGNYSIAGSALDSFSPYPTRPNDDVNFTLEGEFADFDVPAVLPVAIETLSGVVLGDEGYYAQSFTTGDVGLNNISFNFYGGDGSPLSAGTAYLFSSRYFGLVQDIQTATANLVGKSLSGGSVYVFDPTLQLASNTQYFLYTDALMRVVGGGSTLAGSQFYYGDDLGNYLEYTPNADANFTLRGTAVPEPAVWTMMIIGFGSIGGAMRSARRKTREAAIA